jgi:hypothetical protein
MVCEERKWIRHCRLSLYYTGRTLDNRGATPLRSSCEIFIAANIYVEEREMLASRTTRGMPVSHSEARTFDKASIQG